MSAQAQAQTQTCRPPQQPMQEVELTFGRNIGARLGVTERRWSRFLAREITPRFPDGLTVLDAAGQWRDLKRQTLVREPSKIVRIITTADAQPRIDAIVSAYKAQFHQDSVVVLVRPACAGF